MAKTVQLSLDERTSELLERAELEPKPHFHTFDSGEPFDLSPETIKEQLAILDAELAARTLLD